MKLSHVSREQASNYYFTLSGLHFDRADITALSFCKCAERKVEYLEVPHHCTHPDPVQSNKRKRDISKNLNRGRCNQVHNKSVESVNEDYICAEGRKNWWSDANVRLIKGSQTPNYNGDSSTMFSVCRQIPFFLTEFKPEVIETVERMHKRCDGMVP